MKTAIKLILFSPMLLTGLVMAIIRYVWGITVVMSWEFGKQWSDSWLDKTEVWTSNGNTDQKEEKS